jgi:hypothetical protein
MFMFLRSFRILVLVLINQVKRLFSSLFDPWNDRQSQIACSLEKSMRHHLILISMLIAGACASVQAQQKTTKLEEAKAPVEKTAAELEAERILKERRANAQSLLISLAVDARNFSDARVRARVQARIGDMLWDSDRERSRTMFRSAFDAAEVADAESHAKMQEDIRQQQARTGRGGFVIDSPPDLRREVLGIAAKRDPKLGEEFMGRFRDQKTTQSNDAQNRRQDSRVADATSSERYDLARELLSSGDTQSALQFADSGLNSINMLSVDFLARLREKDATAADQRYAAMLRNAAANPQSDGNTASLLASYIFSPNVYVTFQNYAPSVMQSGGPANPPLNLSPELRAAFFQTAISIFMRPTPEQSAGGPDGQYLSLKRLMPLFEQYAPPQITANLKAQLESLAAGASATARTREDPSLRRGIEPDKPATVENNLKEVERQTVNREQTLLDQADRAKTSAERDQAYLQLAMAMVDKDEQRAHDYVDKIEDMELRNATLAYVDASIAWKLVQKREVDRALEFARNSDLTHLQRSWLLSQTAAQIGVKDRERALPVLDEAIAEARRIETGDPDRPRALFAIANVVMRINRAAVWETTGDAITAANSADSFTGEDGQIVFKLNSKGTNAVHQHSFNDFDVAGIFAKLAGEDYDKAVSLARNFQSAAPRANAVIAIAKSVLDEKK